MDPKNFTRNDRLISLAAFFWMKSQLYASYCIDVEAKNDGEIFVGGFGLVKFFLHLSVMVSHYFFNSKNFLRHSSLCVLGEEKPQKFSKFYENNHTVHPSYDRRQGKRVIF